MKLHIEPDPDDGPTVREVHAAMVERQRQLQPQRDVIAFIEARLRDDEQAAREAYGSDALDQYSTRWKIDTEPGPGKQTPGRPSIKTGGMGWETSSGDGIWSCDDGMADDCWRYRREDKAEAAHIIRHDPVRTVREIEAKRTLLAAFAAEEPPPADEWGEVPVHPLLFALAAVWSGHDDFRYTWSPE